MQSPIPIYSVYTAASTREQEAAFVLQTANLQMKKEEVHSEHSRANQKFGGIGAFQTVLPGDPAKSSELHVTDNGVKHGSSGFRPAVPAMAAGL